MGALPQRSSALFTLIADNTENLHQLTEALDEELSYYKKCGESELLHYEEAYSLHQKEQEYYRLAKTLNEQFDEQANRQQRLQTLLQQKDLYQAKEQEIALAEQAERLTLQEQQCKDLRAELNVKELAFQQAKVKQQQSQEQLQEAQENYEIEEAKESERQQILQQEIEMLALLPKFEAYEHNVQQLQIAEQYAENAKRAVHDNLKLLENEQEQLQHFSQSLEGYEKQVEPYESYLEQLPKLREQVALIKQAEKYKHAVELARQDIVASESLYQESKEALQLLQQRWLTSQASILAKQLKEGEPCPVCGSMTHQKAHNEQLEVIELTQVEALRAKASADERKYLEKEAFLASTQQLLQDTWQQLEAQNIKQEDQSQIIVTLHEVEQEIAALKAINHQLADVRLKIKHQHDRIEQLRNKQTKLEQYLAEQIKEWTRLEAVVEEQLKQMPANLPTLQQLKQQLMDVSKQKEALQKLASKSRKFTCCKGSG